MPEVQEIHLMIKGGMAILDLRVGDRWRRVIHATHGDITDHYVYRAGLQLGKDTVDVTDEYPMPPHGSETRVRLENKHV